MATTTSKVSQVGSKYYKTSVTTNADGSLSATTFRTDAKGGNPVAVSSTGVDANGKSLPRTFASTATGEEKAAFSNPNSPERQAYTQQIKSQNPYGSNPSEEQKQKINNAAGKPSEATKPDQAGDGSQPAGATESGQAIGGTKTSGFGDFKYPLDVASTKQDVIKFTMLEYKPSGTGATQSAGSSGRGSLANGIPKDRKIAGSVILPIPSGISDTNSIDWGSNSMNALEAASAAGAYSAITGGIGAGVENLRKSFETAGGEEQTKKALGAAFAGAAVGGSGAAILQRAEGTIVNPNMELLFNGPQLRPFTFTFKMSARSKEEGQEIIKILNFFKRGMSAIKTQSNLFLKAPNTFKIQYLHLGASGKDHPYIGRIKECALQSVVVNYTPEGQYATYYDGVLVSYEMQMTFSELEPVFNSDYDGLDGIGY